MEPTRTGCAQNRPDGGPETVATTTGTNTTATTTNTTAANITSVDNTSPILLNGDNPQCHKPPASNAEEEPEFKRTKVAGMVHTPASEAVVGTSTAGHVSGEPDGKYALVDGRPGGCRGASIPASASGFSMPHVAAVTQLFPINLERFYELEICVSPEKQAEIEQAKQGSERWLHERKCRLSGSMWPFFDYRYRMSSTRPYKPLPLTRFIEKFFNRKLLTIPAVRWGTEREGHGQRVAEDVIKKRHPGCHVDFYYPGGIVPLKDPWFILSVDGLAFVTGSDGVPITTYLIEVKCPSVDFYDAKYTDPIPPGITPHNCKGMLQGPIACTSLCDTVLTLPHTILSPQSITCRLCCTWACYVGMILHVTPLLTSVSSFSGCPMSPKWTCMRTTTNSFRGKCTLACAPSTLTTSYLALRLKLSVSSAMNALQFQHVSRAPSTPQRQEARTQRGPPIMNVPQSQHVRRGQRQRQSISQNFLHKRLLNVSAFV